MGFFYAMEQKIRIPEKKNMPIRILNVVSQGFWSFMSTFIYHLRPTWDLIQNDYGHCVSSLQGGNSQIQQTFTPWGVLKFRMLAMLWLPGTCLSFVLGFFHPPKEGPNSNQNKGHLGSRYIYIYYIYIYSSRFKTRNYMKKKVTFRLLAATSQVWKMLRNRPGNLGFCSGTYPNKMCTSNREIAVTCFSGVVSWYTCWLGVACFACFTRIIHSFVWREPYQPSRFPLRARV